LNLTTGHFQPKPKKFLTYFCSDQLTLLTTAEWDMSSTYGLRGESRDVMKFVFAFDNMRILDSFTAVWYLTNNWRRFWWIRIFHFIQLDWTLLNFT